MARKPLISMSVVGLLAVFLPWRVYPLGLGEIQLDSALSQPLRAEIKLHAAHEVPLKDIQVSLASQEEFARVGVEPALVLGKLRFQLERKASGATVIAITTQDSIRDPFLEFLVTLTWPQGRLSRAYTLLLDPPALPVATTPLPEKMRAASAPFSTAEPRPMAEGITMTAEEVPFQAEQQKIAASPATDEAPSTYGPTTPEDTLWALAQRLRPNPSILPQQMMLALLQANPEAFLHHNLNGLIVGRMLQVPSEEEVLKMSQAEAIQEVQWQNEAWKAFVERKKVAKGEAPRAKASDQEANAVFEGGSSRENKTGAVVAQSDSQTVAVSTGKILDGERVDFEQLLALAHAALQIRTQENEALQSRLQELEQKIGALQEHALDWKKNSSPARPAAHLATTEEAGRPSQQAPGSRPREEALVNAAKQPKTAPGFSENALASDTRQEERNHLQRLYSAFVERKEYLLLGGGSLLLVILVILQVRKRKAREESALLNVAGPSQGVGVEVPAEALNMLSLVLRPEAPEIEVGEITDEPVFSLKTVDDSPAGNSLLKQEAEPRAASEMATELPSDGETADNSKPEATPVAFELEQGEPPLFNPHPMEEENPSASPAGLSNEVQGDGLEFDLSEFSLEDNTPESQQPETAAKDELDLGEIVPFPFDDLTENGDLALESAAEKTPNKGAELPVSPKQDFDADHHCPSVESSGQALMDDLDEIEVKLNLAQAFIEMGSAQEARGILEEVVSAGDQRQRGIGQELLSKLGQA